MDTINEGKAILKVFNAEHKGKVSKVLWMIQIVELYSVNFLWGGKYLNINNMCIQGGLWDWK